MDITPIQYRFSNADLNQIKALGYSIESSELEDIEYMINQYFTNFNLLNLLLTVEKQFSGIEDLKPLKIINLKTKFNIHSIRVSFNNYIPKRTGKELKTNLSFIREFSHYKGLIDVEHLFLLLPKAYRNNGLIKPIFQTSIQEYINMNVSTISLRASLDIGGYVWARIGFVATVKSEVENILLKAETNLKDHQFKIAKRIFDFYYEKYPNGKAFPMDLWAGLEFMKNVLIGSTWSGEIDIKNKSQLDKLIKYAFS